MPGHILFCGVNFDASPQGMNTGKLARALLARGNQVTVVCGREKSRVDFVDPSLELLPLGVQPRHPRWLWKAVADLRGHMPCNHYLWTRRATGVPLRRFPDVVYGRAWPYSSLVAAASLARRIDRPLWIHFSDPFPPPPKLREHPRLMRDLGAIATQALGATFTNDQQRDYQLRFLPPRPPDWAQVLNHIAPVPRRFGPPERRNRFVYLGSFSDTRPPDRLFAGFAIVARRDPEARLHCVGTRPEKVLPVAARMGLEGRVVIEPFVRDIAEWQAAASVLLAVDWLAGEPVYLLTKIVESLVVDRPLFLLTQPGSPGANLLRGFADSSVCVTSQDAEEVARGLLRAADLAEPGVDLAGRFAAMEAFSSDQVAARCERLLLGRIA